MPSKPTGNIPSIKVNIPLNGSPKVQNTTIKFASKKEDIEKQIVEIFVETTKKSGFIFLEVPKQNEQNDFDFTLVLPGGKICLELTEFLMDDKEVPYQTSKTPRTCGELHDEFIQTIENKVKKVNTRLEKNRLRSKEILPVDLLCYTTHSDYNIDDVVVALLQHTLLNYQNPFENIFLLQPVSSNHAHLRVLQPYKGEIIDKDALAKLKNNQLINLL